jgi:hypothetical protein
MTTRVKIQIVQKHVPVIVEVLRSDDTVQIETVLHNSAQEVEEYVHSGQTIRIREMTLQELKELHNRGTT